MTSLRIFFIGGRLSYRALFDWLNPWIYVPTLVFLPILQILLFAYLGRYADLESDQFFLIGNAVQSTSIPCLMAMSATIAGERDDHTLGLVLATPARRVPMFLGRALPAIVNAWIVAMVSLVGGALLLGVSLPASSWPAIALIALVACVSCTGLALAIGSVGLRLRDTTTLPNVTYGLLLIACGVNVPLTALPNWMSGLAQWLPLTHAIEAARQVAASARLSSVGSLVLVELALGVGYTVAGLLLLRYFEVRSRIDATLDIA